jgi:alpha-1,2-mannosyltransferase
MHYVEVDVIGSTRADGLLTRAGILWGAWSCALAGVALAVAVAVVAARGRPNLDGLFNDFYDYWAAGRILERGGSPYDAHLTGHVLAAAGVHSTVGGAYSYPLLLAELARPLAALPPGQAAALFTAGSLAALWLGVALLLSPLHRATPAQLMGVATGAALFAPVVGTLYFGQVNLYLLPLLALAVRGVRPQAGIATAAAVKLYPGATALAFVTRGRGGLRPLVVTVAAALGLSLLPNALTGVWPPRGGMLAMLGPDPFWSNESINGLVSRLPLPGPAVTLAMLAVCVLLGGAVAALVVARRDRTWAGSFALLLCYGVLAAPKNSLWNFAPLLVAGVQWWSASGRRLRAAWLGGLAWTLVSLQGIVDAARGLREGQPVAAGVLGSVALAGGLLLLGMLAHQLLTAPPAFRRLGRQRGLAA